MVISLGAQKEWKLHNMGVKSSLLHGDFQVEVYMTQPLGFNLEGHEHK